MYNQAMILRNPACSSVRLGCAIAVPLLAIATMTGCTEDRVAGGNSSGTSNTIVGRLVDSAGHAARGVHVVARSLQWRPEDSGASSDFVRHAISDSSGNFEFDSLPPDAWVLEATSNSAGHLFGPTISGNSGGDADVGTGVLGDMGPLHGRIRGDSLAGVSGQIRLPGTAHGAKFDAQGRFRIESVPPGTGRLVGEATANGLSWRVLGSVALAPAGRRDSILLDATADFQEDYSTWKSSKKAIIDLASAANYLSSDQYQVPILVRLDASILPEWDLDGSSIRFSSESGQHLPYEIEEWNPVSHSAKIWVRMDTLNENSSKHSLNMHWGKIGAPGRSNASAVFDSSSGWIGAWHFAESRPWQNSTQRSPTFQRGIEAAASIPTHDGIRLTRNSSLVLNDPALAVTAGVTVIAFVKIDSVLLDHAFLVRQGAEDSSSFDWALSLRDSSGNLGASFATRLQPWSPAPPKTTGPLPRSSWTFLGGVFDTASRRARLELPDGVSRWTIPYDTFHQRNPKPALVVGPGLVGTIDEIRLMRRPMHPDFVRAQWISWNPTSEMLRWQE